MLFFSSSFSTLFFIINFMIMQQIKKFNNNIFIFNSKDLIIILAIYW